MPRFFTYTILIDTMNVTPRSENFIMWDNGNEDVTRIFKLGTETNLQLLSNISTDS